ncbi:hypothetical protein Tco_1081818 [Tanacetum coccineum]|uniref:Uncharacterized protein n=1 Tax=Tanacetum coccineum TaxID=301880 RepID=A0ABQ5HYS5_9ASTR
MGGYKHSQLKNKSFEEIQKLFDKKITRVNMFVDMNNEMKGSSKKAKADTTQESSSKRASDELEQEKAKKQKIDDDKEEAEMKKLIEIVPDEEEVTMDAIPLATKPPSIVDWKIIKERKISFYQIIRADGNSKRYSAFIHMIKDFDRDDLETLWRLVKAKHGETRPEEEYERVLFDSCGVHFVRFKDLHIFMLVEKRYPLTPITITNMLNKKLQADHWNEMWRIVGIKRLLKVAAAKVRVTAAKHNLVLTARVKLVLLVKNEENILSTYYCLCSVSAADYKVTTAEKITTAEKG